MSYYLRHLLHQAWRPWAWLADRLVPRTNAGWLLVATTPMALVVATIAWAGTIKTQADANTCVLQGYFHDVQKRNEREIRTAVGKDIPATQQRIDDARRAIVRLEGTTCSG